MAGLLELVAEEQGRQREQLLEPWFAAARAGDAAAVMRLVPQLLAAGLDLEEEQQKGGHDPDEWEGSEEFGCVDPCYTALHYAAEGGHAGVVRVLLAAGLDVNSATTDAQLTALHIAAGQGHSKVIAMLLAAGADPNLAAYREFTTLHMAADDPATMQALLASGADVHAVQEGNTVLHLAAAGGCPEGVRLLLDAGANPNAADTDGHTPLHSAAHGPIPGHQGDLAPYENWWGPASSDQNPTERVRMLLAAGADPDAATHSGSTPLSAAAESLAFERYSLCGPKHPTTVAVLLSAGANNWGKPFRGGSTFPGLELALAEVWEAVPARLAELVARMEPERRARIRTALLCLRLRTPLVKPELYMHVLGLACMGRCRCRACRKA